MPSNIMASNQVYSNLFLKAGYAVTLPNPGGNTQVQLEWYDKQSVSALASGIWGVPVTIPVDLICERIGNIVFLSITEANAVTVGGAAITISAPIPLQFRPTLTDRSTLILVNNNGTVVSGYINVTTAGVVTIQPVSGSFTSPGLSGIGDVSTASWQLV